MQPSTRPTARDTGAPAAMVPAVSRALTLLDRLAQRREPMSLARLATDLALPKSSVHGLCNTLMSYGYLRRRPDGAFTIGPRVMSLAEAFVSGISVTQEFENLWQGGVAVPDETMVLSVLDGTDVVYVGARNGTRPLGLAFSVGMRLPAHLAATGKAMLAHACRDAEAVRGLFGDEPLPRLTGRGPRDAAALARELAQVRRRGYSIDDEGVREGAYCFGAPVFDATRQPVAGVGICVHKSRLGADRGEAYLKAVLEAAATMSRRLGADLPEQAAEPAARPAPRRRVSTPPKAAR